MGFLPEINDLVVVYTGNLLDVQRRYFAMIPSSFN